jgi:hypothetical protein
LISASSDATVEQDNLAAALAAANDGLVPLHAAGIERHGLVIALAGPSGAGKSTLAAAAVLAGCGYVADEVTAVRPSDLAVRPFHRPIGLRRGGAEALGIELPPGFRGSGPTPYLWDVTSWGRMSAGGRLAGILIVTRANGEPALIELAPAAALAEISQHTVIPDDRLRPAFAGLDQIVRVVPVVRARFATPTEGVALIDTLLARSGE